MPPHRRPSRRLGLSALAAPLSLLILPVSVLAHAELESSSPAAGSTVTGPIDQVVLTFSEALQAQSRFAIRLGDEEVARGRPDPDRPDTMVVDASNLGPGEYTVGIFAVGSDGHAERPTFTFTIVAGASETPSPSPSPSASPSESPVPSGSPSASPTASLSPSATPSPSADPPPVAATGGDMAVPILATLVVMGGLGLWMLRRQRRV